jgi:tetratricopeptide (TPR) repeat protein
MRKYECLIIRCRNEKVEVLHMSIINEAIQLIENGLTEEGLSKLQSVLKNANDEEKYEIALIFQSLGLVEEAKNIIEDLYYLYDEDEELKIILSELLIDLDEEDQALNLLLTIKPESDFRVQALLLVADIYQVQGLDEVAESKLLEAKRMLPDEPVIDFALGEYYFSKYEYSKAIPYYEGLTSKDIDLKGVNKKLRLAECLSAEGEWDEAVPYYESGIEDSKDFHTLLGYGITLFQAERYSAAIPILEEAIFFDEEYIVAYLWLSKAFEMEGQISESYETLQKAIKVDETNVDSQLAAAKIARKLKYHEECKKHLGEALTYDPSLIEGVQLLVGIYFEEEDFGSVIDTISLAMNHGAFDPQFNWDLAKAYNQIEKYDEALNYYRTAYNDFNQEMTFLKEYGDFLYEEGLHKEAKEIYQKLTTDDLLMEDVLERLDRLNDLE